MSEPPRASFDVVVIGAGVLGASIALELARSERSVVCVDAGPAVGAGSTSASAAVVRFHYSTLPSVITAWESAQRWLEFADHLGTTDPDGMVSFHRIGCLLYDFPGTNRDTVFAHYDAVGISYEYLDAAALAQRFPALDGGDYSPPKAIDDPAFADEAKHPIGAYYQPDCGFIDDPMRAAANFMFAAREHGAELRLRSEVVAIRRLDDHVAGVTLADGTDIDAPVVVNVAGPASGIVNRMAGVTDDMRVGHRPLRQEMHVAESFDGFEFGTSPFVVDVGLGAYIRPHLGQTLLVGSLEPECDELEWVDDPNDFNDRPTVDGFERNMWRAARRLPTLGIPHRPVGLAGLYDAADDWTPIYDKSSLAGFFMACATSGNQFKNAPMVGAFLTALVDAADNGVDHDIEPVEIVGPATGLTIDLAAFSRRREPSHTTGTVLG